MGIANCLVVTNNKRRRANPIKTLTFSIFFILGLSMIKLEQGLRFAFLYLS
ncbi:hypothetical protein [Shimazuella kribbensis]|uniref:hypothetical protein n=1 Tax=Shimazuella kribbensis TaxID=139808 RepID=UPI0004151EDA|nr:hypothetical protein [Shimazuella kribbensis]